jgi:hypothetical protein
LNACGELGAEQTGVGSLVRKPPTGHESSFDSARGELTIRKKVAVPGHHNR